MSITTKPGNIMSLLFINIGVSGARVNMHYASDARASSHIVPTITSEVDGLSSTASCPQMGWNKTLRPWWQEIFSYCEWEPQWTDVSVWYAGPTSAAPSSGRGDRCKHQMGAVLWRHVPHSQLHFTRFPDLALLQDKVSTKHLSLLYLCAYMIK